MQKKTLLLSALLASGITGFIACADKKPSSNQPLDTQELTKNQAEEHGLPIKAGDVQITHPLNAEWVAGGKAIYDLKCQSCHKLTNEKLVGPGWKGVTQRRKPEWILNMITNVDIMLEQDPQAQKLLEECLVRMPNQNLSKDEARKVLEFQRSNDGEK
ncbi:MAG: c-type cytochrome [Flavisolibacter sp.]